MLTFSLEILFFWLGDFRHPSLPITWLPFLVDATDSKGEPIHQTLMAKKMQRLDESPDFRPFKFRIQAFTNAFLEEVVRFPSTVPPRVPSD